MLTLIAGKLFMMDIAEPVIFLRCKNEFINQRVGFVISQSNLVSLCQEALDQTIQRSLQ